MTAVEDRLRAALSARANQVTEVGPSRRPPVGHRTGVRPALRKAAVVALVAVVATVVLILPHLLSHDDPPRPANTPPASPPSVSGSPAPPTAETPAPVAPRRE